MSVLKSKRKPSQFEVFHHLAKMRKEVTDFLLMDFGYSEDKAKKKVQHQFGGRSREELTDAEKERYDKIKKRMEAFNEWFIEDERKAVTDCLRNIGRCIFSANANIPQYRQELVERRILQDEALGYLETLKQELQYTIETLPVDINKYVRFSDMIEQEIKLIKAWRKSDNRFKAIVLQDENITGKQ